MIEEVKKEIQRQLRESEERLSHIKAKGWVAPNEEQLIVHLKSLLSFINTFEVKEQKPAKWSKEDEDMLILSIKYLEDSKTVQYDRSLEVEKCKAWLKSLRPQSHWKPSDEQMKALWNIYQGGKEQAELATLYNDLKKLKD